MPYLPESQRFSFSEHAALYDPSELNYAITTLVANYVKFHGLKYSTINDVMGALESAKQEFYRRVAAPYEDTKIKENGDVY